MFNRHWNFEVSCSTMSWDGYVIITHTSAYQGFTRRFSGMSCITTPCMYAPSFQVRSKIDLVVRNSKEDYLRAGN